MEKNNHDSAAETIWQWRDIGVDHDKVDPKKLQKQALLRALFMSVMAVVFYYIEAYVLLWIIVPMMCITLIAAWVSPGGAYQAMDRAAYALVEFFGKLLQWLVLPVIYYLFFALWGNIFRRGQSDRMQRHLVKNTKSYWQSASSSGEQDRSKQF